jgi:hypothetical protein
VKDSANFCARLLRLSFGELGVLPWASGKLCSKLEEELEGEEVARFHNFLWEDVSRSVDRRFSKATALAFVIAVLRAFLASRYLSLDGASFLLEKRFFAWRKWL